jgi:hypothetical protein
MDLLKTRIPKLHYVRFTDDNERLKYRSAVQDL